MSSKLLSVCLGVAVFGSIGCTGEFISRSIYDRDVNQLKEYNQALERDNAEMRAKADGYDQLRREMTIAGDADKTFAELAASLKKALESLNVPDHMVIVDPKRQSITLSDDLLTFDLGKFEVTSQGKAVIRKIVETHPGMMYRLVGHTDRKPITRATTREKLITDSNPELSVLRAVAVMGEFMKCGVHENQFASVEGHGWLEPRGDAKTSRRVEIFFVGDAAPEGPRTVKTSAPRGSKK
ncbi:MAG TPA: OmpA family protein [Planctomycetota bacterium]|nr:OmpA family protein [Planctomycetota bacterium]